ncbi:MAG: hypothetical protein ACKOAD_05180, partial [Gammaproteobacteria bacterium]
MNVVHPLNASLFAVDSLFHCGDSLVLDAGTGYSRYAWSSGDTTQIKVVRSTGWHLVRVYDGLCSVEDSVFVSLISSHLNTQDTVICQGNSITLNVESLSLNNSMLDLVVGQGQIYYTDSVRSELLYSVPMGQSVINLNNVQGFTVGSIVLIHQTKISNSINDTFAGKFCYKKVIQVSGNSLVLDEPLEVSFYANQEGNAQVIKVPIWRNVLIQGTVACHEWNGLTGGILAFSGKKIILNNNGLISASGKGFHGGQTVSGWGGGYQGESYQGELQRNYLANYSGGGGGNAEWCHSGQGGGGGGYLNQGQYGGVPCYGCGGGWWFGSCGNSGFAGNPTSIYNNNSILGSGGGSGGIDGDNPDGGGFGGRGGGIIIIDCPDISGSGVIESRGMNGDSSPGETGGGGGGSGGFIGLNDTPIGILLDVEGGQGGKKWDSRFGGDGSVGKIEPSLELNLPLSSNSYLWSTGDTTSSITVSPTQTTTYYVTVSNGIHSCVDSVTVNVLSPPANLISMDTLAVCDQSVAIQAGAGFNSYQWSGQGMGSTITVTETGWYYCTAIYGQCAVIDSVFVSLINHKITQNDTTIAFGSSIQIDVLGITNAGNSSSFINLVDGAHNVIKSGPNYFFRTYYDVVEYSPSTQSLASTGFNVQVNVAPPSELLGITPSGNLMTGSGWNCIYRRDGTSWNSVGLCGFGTGGQGFVVGASGRIILTKGGFLRSVYYSDNNGDNWVNATGHDVDWNAMTLANNGRLLTVSCCGGTGTKGLLQSDDNGTSWYYANSSVPLSTSRWLSKSSDGTLWLIADDFKIYKSNNHGDVWQFVQNLPIGTIGHQIEYFNNKLYVATTNSEFLVSNDMGVTWQNRSSEINNQTINRLKIVDGRLFVLTPSGAWVFGNSVHPMSYAWSTGDTTASITVSPNQTTTYYVTMSNGIT